MSQSKDQAQSAQDAVPPMILKEAADAAIGAQNDEPRPQTAKSSHHHEHFPDLENVPPPAYDGKAYGQIDISQNGLDTGAHVGKDGRVNIKINQRSHKISDLLVPALRKQLDLVQKEKDEPTIPDGLGETDGLPPPPMNIVIQIVGSRGDVQPFVALAQVLKNKYRHRVRIATHPTFKDFVTENGLEFFSIGGDPAELMAFMVKNPGLMPGMDSLKAGDIGKRRKGIYEMVTGCWRSCIEAGDGTGVQVYDHNPDAASFDSGIHMGDPTQKPFVADAIIANPPSFAHMHIAEKLGIPLHLMFTMPWSPTQSFPHPLANIISSNTDKNMANFMTYALVDMLTWQGLGDVINRFREKSLNLEPVSVMWAPGMASRLRIPWTYCWSPALIPKPADWGNYIDISGFYFLNLASNYTPPKELADFLAAGPPPVYIGFGSIVVDDPNAMTKMIFDAVKKTGQRALVSKGWGGLGAGEIGIPEGVYMLGNCPHDWLFQHVSCVVHHGGAGTTATGISAGRPTVVVPFFGDQPFWGSMVARAGAGPMPIPYKELNADKLAKQIEAALKPESLERAKELSAKIKAESGTDSGADSFHKQLHMNDLRCSLLPDRVAVWRVKRTDIRLSTLAATVLGNEGLLSFTDLKLYRSREYLTDDGPWDPISGGAGALIGTIGNLTMGFADFPVELFKSLGRASTDVREAHKKTKSSSPTDSNPMSPRPSISTGPQLPSATQSSTTLVSEDSQTNVERRESASSSVVALTPTASATEADTPRTPRAMSSVMSNESVGRRSSRSGSRHGHRLSEQINKKLDSYGKSEQQPCPGEDMGHITLETAVGGIKAGSRIVNAGIKAPMDFTLSLAKGFHNAPKLYGDDTVRKAGKITGIQSGLTEAGKEFGYGFYDGITGLVTQPLAGAKKEGFGGFLKGAAKGIGGLILKPGAGIWGLPGYTAKGIYAELAKVFGSSVQNYIIAARTAQGYEEWKESTAEDRETIVREWKSNRIETRKRGQKWGKEKEAEIESHILTRTNTDSVELMHGFKNTRHLTWDERKALDDRKQQLKKQEKEMQRKESNVRKEDKKKDGKVKSWCKHCPFDHDSDHHLRHVSSFPTPLNPVSYGRDHEKDDELLHPELEQTIQKSVTATSRGNPEEDIMIERALRASLKTLSKAQTADDAPHDDTAYDSAIAASIAEARKHRQEQGRPTTSSSTEDLHDQELARVLSASMQEHKKTQGGQETGIVASPIGMGKGEHAGHHLHRHHDATGQDDSDSGIDTENDEEFKRTIEESKRLHTEREEAAKAAAVNVEEVDGDEELEKAMKESQLEHSQHQEGLERQKTEDEIVLEHIKRQSLLEEQYRKAHAQSTA